MTTINATNARANLYSLINDVNENSTPITIVNSRGKNAVLISEDDWNSINETLYLYSIPGMVESILESKKESDENPDSLTVYDKETFWDNV